MLRRTNRFTRKPKLKQMVTHVSVTISCVVQQWNGQNIVNYTRTVMDKYSILIWKSILLHTIATTRTSWSKFVLCVKSFRDERPVDTCVAYDWFYLEDGRRYQILKHGNQLQDPCSLSWLRQIALLRNPHRLRYTMIFGHGKVDLQEIAAMTCNPRFAKGIDTKRVELNPFLVIVRCISNGKSYFRMLKGIGAVGFGDEIHQWQGAPVVTQSLFEGKPDYCGDFCSGHLEKLRDRCWKRIAMISSLHRPTLAKVDLSQFLRKSGRNAVGSHPQQVI